MRKKLTAPTLVERMNAEEAVRTAPGPPPTECSYCEQGTYFTRCIEWQPFCSDCLDEDAFLANAREHSALT